MEIKSYYVGKRILYNCRIWYYKNKIKKSKFKSGFTRKKDAEKWGESTKRKLKGLHLNADKTTVREYLESWIKTKENKLSPTTIRGYKTNIAHINEYIGDDMVMQLKLIDIQGMLDSLSNKGLKYRTVKYVYRTLHAALNYAVKTELLDKNVSKGCEIKEDEEQFEAIVYSSDDLKKLILLLREQEHNLYPPVLLASMRGLRRGECLGLRWADINFENCTASVQKNYVKVGKKEYLRKVKTKESIRKINIEGFVASELKNLKERITKERNRVPLYVCEIDGQLPDPSHISRQLKIFQKYNSLPVCRFHDLRHTFAVLQLEYGTDLDTLKRLLGHSKVAITSDMYLHPNQTLIKKASLAMDNIVNMDCDKNVIKVENEK